MTLYIYVTAADLSHAREVHALLRAEGMKPTNRAVDDHDDETLFGARLDLANAEADEDMRASHAALVLSPDGEALCEAARAVLLGIPVVWVGRLVRTAYRSGVTQVGSVAEAVKALRAMAPMGGKRAVA